MSDKTIPRDELDAPGPIVTKLVTSSKHRITIAWFRRATLIEFEDALFRLNSAVMMPAGEDPSPTEESGQQRTAVGLTASVLRVAEERAELQVFVAGHADTTGADAYNIELSQWRADCVTAVLTGDSQSWATICNNVKRMRVADYQQILTWLAQTRGWDCDPGGIDDVHGNQTQTAVNNFRAAYNAEGPGASWAPKVTPWGAANNDETWVAYFNCYEEALMGELGVEFAGLAALRKGLRFIDPRRSVGCGEHHPKEAENVDEFRSQTNRRVEVLFFEPTEVPSLACHPGPGQCDPDACELYDPEQFRRRVLPPLLSALPWRAHWDSGFARMDETHELILDAPGLPAGHPMRFVISQQGFGPVAELTVPSGPQRAAVAFSDWEHPKSYVDAGDLGPGGVFEQVRFTFVVEGAGRRIEGGAITYGDRLHVQLVLEDDTPIAEQRVRVISPWGTRTIDSDAEGMVEVDGLPPGGASVVLRDRTLVHQGELPHDWEGDD